MPIAERQFPLYESVILADQMPAHRVPEFLKENPEFKAWYVARRDRSRQGADDLTATWQPRELSC